MTDGSEPQERIIQRMVNPIDGEVMMQLVDLGDGRLAIDLLTDAAVFFGRRLLPPTPAVLTRSDGKPGERWLYRLPAGTELRTEPDVPITLDAFKTMTADLGGTTIKVTRSERRRVEKAVKRLLNQAGDNCSLCGSEFPHNSRTYGGAAADGAAALTSDCCRHRLKWIGMQGVYSKCDYGYDPEVLWQSAGKRRRRPGSNAQLTLALDQFQRQIAAIDQAIVSAAAKQSGQPSSSPLPALNHGDTAWKADDAAWFKANPERSHRARPPCEGELATLLKEPEPVPPDHVAQVVVRQVWPGMRIRKSWYRDVHAPTVDRESYLHALFDLLQESRAYGPITAQEIWQREQHYVEAQHRDRS